MKISNSPTNSFFIKLAIHSILWLLVIQLFFDVSGLYYSIKELILEDNRRFDDAFIIIPIMLVLFYWNTEWLIPKFLNQKSWWKYLIGIILVLAIAQTVGFFIGWFVQNKGYYIEHDLEDLFDFQLSFNFIIVGISTSLGVSKLALENAAQKKEAMEKQKEAELKYLTAQVNPHFLYNTLNTIYSLANDENAPTTQDAVLKLSKMMRFMVKEASQPKITLEEEIIFLQDFIDLQLLRLADAIPVHFTIKGAVKQQKIAPLLLIPFVENTFKHGVQYQPPAPIYIDLIIDNQIVQLITKNPLKKQKAKPTSGTGLDNVRKRLAFLYPNKHELEVSTVMQEYKTFLKIDCS